ncbi:ABC transporter permease [Hyphomonas sp. NPDC076900]|uniref:ABC transporter permease n=1 Tax=unclassified Hyphomonas TaxID=2630699 RepID=UPI003D0505B9
MRNIYLVFRRDYLGYVKAWGFWLSLAAVPLFLIVGASFGYFAATASPVRYFAVVEPTRIYADAIEGEFQRRSSEAAAEARALAEQMNIPLAEAQDQVADAAGGRKFIEVPAPARTLEELRPWLTGERTIAGPAGERPLFAVFILSEDGSQLEYWSGDVNVDTLQRTAEIAMRDLSRRDALAASGLNPDFLKQADGAAIKVPAFRLNATQAGESGAEVTMADRAPAIVSAALAYFLWLMIFSIIQYLLMGTIEERSNKIFDTLLTSVQLPQLLAGKMLAVFAVTSTMMLSWSLFGIVGSAVSASQVPGMADMIQPFIAAVTDPKLIIPALVSFVLGYILYGTLFMALGSLCDTIQEAQTLLSPMMILLMLPMFAIFVAFQDPGSPIVDVASWIPLFTPFLLILRMPHDPPMWEVLAQMGMMVVITALVVWGATKVYRAGAVHGAGIGELGGMIKRAVGMKPKAG